eukprot:364958-Chlamydomonas_euryale.AAC.8
MRRHAVGSRLTHGTNISASMRCHPVGSWLTHGAFSLRPQAVTQMALSWHARRSLRPQAVTQMTLSWHARRSLSLRPQKPDESPIWPSADKWATPRVRKLPPHSSFGRSVPFQFTVPCLLAAVTNRCLTCRHQ